MVAGKNTECEEEDNREYSNEETDGIAQEAVDDSLFEAPSEEQIPYSLDEEDHHFTDKDVDISAVNEMEVEVQRHVGQHIDGNGGQ